MLELFYIISMAVAFTYKYDGALTNFWLKYIIAGMWIGLWLLNLLFKRKYLGGTSLFYIKQYITPTALIYLWTILMYILNTPAGFNFSYFSRSTSDILCLALAGLSAIAASYFFQRRVIQLSVYAILLSTLANVIRAIQIYGMPIFLQFLRTATLVTDFDVTRPTYRISQMLEVHDSTVACGYFLIYYLFFCNKQDKSRWENVIAMIFCAYVGFKRVTFIGVAVVFFLLILLKAKESKIEMVIKWVAIGIFGAAFAYLIAIKIDLLSIIADWLHLDFVGRLDIYANLRKYYSLSPLHLGTGYGFINKYFVEQTGYASHSDIVRLYIELGFLPYILWLYHYLKRVPTRVYRKFGEEATRVIMATTIYAFVTYFVGNAMTLFCIQFSFILVPVALSYPEETNVPKKMFRMGSIRI